MLLNMLLNGKNKFEPVGNSEYTFGAEEWKINTL